MPVKLRGITLVRRASRRKWETRRIGRRRAASRADAHSGNMSRVMTRTHAVASILALAFAACGSSANAPTEAGAGVDARDAAADELPDAAFDVASDVAEVGYGVDGGPCTPGVPRCHGDFGYQMCDQDGAWSESHSCAGYSANGTTSYCAEIPMAGGGAWATCVDPACWYWLGRGALGGAMQVGICEADGTLQACGAGGTLAPATCDGVCTRVATLDGRAVGYCAPACEDGARECLGGPFYRTCAGGRWGATVATCDGACNPVATGARPDIRCGGACDPGTSRCRADLGAVETCAPSGTWTLDRACLLGRCRPAGPQAECETECAPGEHQCAFDGAGAERVCDAHGLWMAETPCAAGTSCRASGDFAKGCVACVGGGNAFGAADGRCGPQGVDPQGVETCGADDHWQADAPCPDGHVCASLARGASTLAACQLP
jgi:hypothetical protein